MVATPSKGFLTRKAGPLPVWTWGAIVLGAAYAYSRYKSGTSSSSTTDTTTASSSAEPSSGAPYFVIENNEPADASTTSVAVTPPGTGASPPVNASGAGPLPIQTVAPHTPTGVASSGSAAMGGTTVTPGEVIQPPVQVKAGETWASIAKTFGISAEHLQQANPSLGTAPLKAGQVIGVPYLVKPGMTVASIAKQFGIAVPHLEEYLPKNPT